YAGLGTDAVIVNGTDAVADSFILDVSRVSLNGLDHLGDGIEQWTLNAKGSGDVVTVRGGSGTVKGGSSTDTLINDIPWNSNWYITAQNAGNLNGNVFFTSIEHLVGGASADVFHLSEGVGVSGQVDGGGSAEDGLDYSAFTTAVTVNLQS